MAPCSGGYMFSERESKQVLASVGISVVRDLRAQSAAEAVEAARQIGFPVAVKVDAADIPHKYDMGGVKINLRDKQAVVDACEAITAACREKEPAVETIGFSVKHMGRAGVEWKKGR